MPFTEPPPPRGAPPDCWFDAGAARAACDFFERYLFHTEGRWAHRPFVLREWQRDIVAPLFGWRRPADDGGTPVRLYRHAYIEVGRKNGKTELAAGLALLLLVGDAEAGGQVYSAAVDREQAKLVFGKAATMVLRSEALAKRIEVLRTAIYVPSCLASFKPLSSGAEGKHGLSPHGVVKDELHAWPSGELDDVLHKGMAARRQPMEIDITTAGIRGHSYGWQVHHRALQVREGIIEDPTMLVAIHAADPDDDWRKEEVWRKANPNYGVSVDPRFLSAECRRAEESARAENDFKRFHLNIWTEQVTRWLPMDRWDACAGPIGWQDLAAALAGRRCFTGLDLSATVDITAIVHVFPPRDGSEPWFVIPRFFVPADRVRERVTRDRVPYDQWERIGAIRTTPGNAIDQEAIMAALIEDGRRFDIAEVPFDRWGARAVAMRLQEDGLTTVEFGQGFVSMSEPAKRLEVEVLKGRLAHGGHPVLRWMAANAVVKTDPAGNIKPDKEKASEKIDGIVALIMALGRATTDAGPARGLVIPGDYSVAAA